MNTPQRKFGVNAFIVPRVTCDLPLHPVPFESSWDHLSNIDLADPDFGRPGRIDLLLGVDIFTEVLLQGQQSGPPGSPVALETQFGWVLAGRINPLQDGLSTYHVVSHHVMSYSTDDILRKFWEIEEHQPNIALTPEERMVVRHFDSNHLRDEDGRFIVPLPRRPDAKPIRESRSQALRRFLYPLSSKGQLSEFHSMIKKNTLRYITLN